MGYYRAGFDVVGVDINPQPHYPFEFYRADALTFPLDGFDAIHASPPCQRYSAGAKATGNQNQHPDFYDPIRQRLLRTNVPFVIENVLGAPYSHGFVLCGSMFGMGIQRHRNFETRDMMLLPFRCDHTGARPVTITGDGERIVEGIRDYVHSRHADKSLWPELMGMPWAEGREISEAIPPAYTEWIGGQIIFAVVNRSAVAV